MPAHMGISGRFAAIQTFFHLNMSLNDDAKQYRTRLRGERVIQRLTGKQVIHGSGLASASDAMNLVRTSAKRMRETEYGNYASYRTGLDFYNPNRPLRRGEPADARLTTSATEWELYLQPGTAFDQFCEQYSAEHRGDKGFKFMLIRHSTKVRRSQLKRIEGILGSGKVDILWSDAG